MNSSSIFHMAGTWLLIAGSTLLVFFITREVFRHAGWTLWTRRRRAMAAPD